MQFMFSIRTDQTDRGKYYQADDKLNPEVDMVKITLQNCRIVDSTPPGTRRDASVRINHLAADIW